MSNFYESVIQIHYYYEIVLMLISSFLNMVVIYLVLTTKNKVMKNFCMALLFSVFGDIFYTVTNFISMMIVEIRGGKMFFMTVGYFSNSPYPYNALMTSLWLTGMYVTIMTVMVQFVFRYYTLSKHGMTILQLMGVYSLGMTWALSQGFAAFICFDDVSPADTKIIRTHPMYAKDTPQYMSGDTSNFGAIAHFMCSQVSILVMYCIIIFTGRRIYKLLNTDVEMSQNTRNAQKKLNMVMTLQATYPGLIVGLPVVVATGLAEAKYDIEWGGIYFVTSISCIPIINSLTVLVVIPSFRRRILSAFTGYSHSAVTQGSISKEKITTLATTHAEHLAM
ncbi:unnamed protein product [Bursaphelenchus okinawaensis]|uniref:G_PROTEIN_RECEP_F1_2 domain-containing protein n=1 Tax=Bursaphelenchus okinawaensis TaxID=465554 RepID=A0A811KWY6_9BILA|nr:unnamed protein product [Bursaphelenchus okinawaensis]CAG9113545.1 unnamed protein product [Bursaphelenchus okinawaensis]